MTKIRYCIGTEDGLYLHISRLGEEWTTTYKWRATPRFWDKEDAQRLYQEYHRLSGAVSCYIVEESFIKGLP
jgi:hypothetical protein